MQVELLVSYEVLRLGYVTAQQAAACLKIQHWVHARLNTTFQPLINCFVLVAADQLPPESLLQPGISSNDTKASTPWQQQAAPCQDGRSSLGGSSSSARWHLRQVSGVQHADEAAAGGAAVGDDTQLILHGGGSVSVSDICQLDLSMLSADQVRLLLWSMSCYVCTRSQHMPAHAFRRAPGWDAAHGTAAGLCIVHLFLVPNLTTP